MEMKLLRWVGKDVDLFLRHLHLPQSHHQVRILFHELDCDVTDICCAHMQSHT